MGRKDDLESLIKESYGFIYQYEQIIKTSDRPEEIARSRRQIETHWQFIKDYLDEYLPLCERLHVDVANDVIGIVAHFPDYIERLRNSILNQATGDLQGVLRDEGLSDPEQAAQTIAANIPAERPLLFKTGLCRGYPLEPSPHQYFVAQEFSSDCDDLLRALEEAFSEFNLEPYRADQDIQSGHILCKIAAKIQTTLFSVFELTRTQNRNVYLELGVAIGLGRPFVLVKEADAKVSTLAQGLEYYNIRSYLSLQRELGDRLRQYLLNITHYRAPDLPSAGSVGTVVIAHGNYDMPPDLCLTLAEALADRGLTPVLTGADTREAAQALELEGINHQGITSTGKAQLDAVAEAIQAARFGIYRVDADCSADAFLALGIAVGLNRPWALIWREGATLPSDVRGLSGLPFRSFTDLGKQFPQRFGDFLERYAYA
jgi:hypothetical protein